MNTTMLAQFGGTLRFEQDAVRSMASRWPSSLEFATSSNQSLSNVFPHLFAHAFPAVTDEQLERLSLAGLYVSGAMMELDGIVDDDVPADRDRRAESAFRSHVLHFESFAVLSALFPSGSPFWERFRDRFAEHTDANLTERAFARGARAFAEYDEPTAHRVAIGKAAMSRLAVAALTELGGERDAADALDASICAYSVARQIFDDLQDWRRDLRSRIPTPVIAAILDAFPPAGTEPSEADLARRLHYEGHSRRFLASALQFADEAFALAERAPRWRAVVDNLRGLIATTATDVARIVEENLARVRDRAGDAPFELAPGVLAGRPALRAALDVVVAQWRLGFGETRHLMNFDLQTGAYTCQRGDVFARALIVDALEEVQRHGVDVRPLIERELDYLLSVRRPGRVGGWAYFPELRELPPDADDLAQVAIALVRAGRHGDVARYCEPPLAVLLDDCAHDDGSYETWIIPREARSPEEELQAHFSRIAWGLGSDPEVVANLLHALRLMDAERHRDRIERGTSYLEAAQAADGSWASTWYHGPYYGTYVAARAIARTRPASAALANAHGFLLASRLADGSWGLHGAGDPLSTSFALLALHEIADAVPGARRLIEPAVAWLEDRCVHGFEPVDFIRMEIGRAFGHHDNVATFKSRTLTAAFVLKALALVTP